MKNNFQKKVERMRLTNKKVVYEISYNTVEIMIQSLDRFPLILSIENHLGVNMQEKFAKMIKEKLKGQ